VKAHRVSAVYVKYSHNTIKLDVYRSAMLSNCSLLSKYLIINTRT